MKRAVIIVCMFVLFSVGVEAATGSVVNDLALERMCGEDEIVTTRSYNVKPSQDIYLNNNAMIESFDVAENGNIVLALDNQTIIVCDPEMHPLKLYTYTYPSGIKAIIAEEGNLYVFWVRLINCSEINMDNDTIKEYEWIDDTRINEASNKLSNRVYIHQGDNDYFISSNKDKQKSGLKKNYRYLIRVDEKGEKTILYESNNKHDFEFANITQPIILAGILLANILIIGVRRRRKHD